MQSQDKNKTIQLISPESFMTRFRNLIILAWTAPPVVGLSFLLYIRMFSGEQMLGIMKSPLESIFIVGSLISAVWFFIHFVKPIVQILKIKNFTDSDAAVNRMRQFPLVFWSIFLIYLLIAPSTVIVSAEIYTDFVASPIDWFRIHLVALIVSIIVGLPIFFLFLDLFGKVMGPIGVDKPHITIKAKVFMIGALVPLLIDTMLVQYFWTRTGFFTFETFVVWLVLELLAIVGSVIFVRSFSQSLQPLQNWSNLSRSTDENDNIDLLRPQSTDELGVLATNYGRLINSWKINNEILKLNAQIIRSSGSAASLAEVVDNVISLCDEAIGDDITFLILKDVDKDELVGIAQSGEPYKREGYYRLNLDETSLANWIYKNGKSATIVDVNEDDRVSARMVEYFNVKSTMGVPLQIGNKTIGVLMTINQQRHRNYSLRDCMLLEGIAREVAYAVQTNQLNQQRMEVEQEKTNKEELIYLLMDSTAEGIYGFDLNGICIFINKAGLKMLGYESEDELLGNSIHEIIHHTHPDGSAYPIEKCEIILATDRGSASHSDREFHWRKNGSGFPSEYWSHPIYKEGNIVGTVVTFIDITERIESQKVIQYQAHYDKLTGLPNRWLLQDRLGQNIAVASREQQHTALMFLDLDRFKTINDTLGHEFGDDVLLEVANRLSKLVREGDTLARLGGDEFVMLLTSLHEKNEAIDVALRILQEIKKPLKVRDRDVHLGASIGIAIYPEHGLDSNTLLKHADFAMYRAKEKGGDNFQFYTSRIHEEASNRYKLETELHNAILANKLDINYQPQYNMETGEVIGAEALCRWNSDVLGIVKVEDFISVAEETGLITSLGFCVINQVIDDILEWKNKGLKVPRIAINLSARQINNDETVSMIIQTLKDKGISGECLEFEITEHSLMEDPQHVAANISKIKALGANIAIDDFGTGYSSLSYLKRFSVDILKIDRSFVTDLSTNTDDQVIAETIIAMAKTLGLSVVAEGVENKAQADFLLEKGCLIGQGYLFSKPVTAKECDKIFMI
jgi:diguanylate cyclase (GGDEF)-like protein/PAS domain S-box-containing protein